MNIVLWIIQILLALLFLFAGGTKLLPISDAAATTKHVDAPDVVSQIYRRM